MSKTVKLSIAYTLIVVVALVLILGFCLKKSYNPEIDAPNIISITTASGQAEYDGGDDTNNKERFNELYKEYTEATSENFVSALFSGNMFYASRIELLSSVPSFEGYKMMFKYAQEQTIMLNGKEYAHASASSVILKYDTVYFDVVDTDGIEKVNMYYKVTTTQNNNQKTEYYKRAVLADFSALHQAIVDAQ
ncbi:MAG: hypothetical protein IJA69_02390 [Clostridia bacterium]|nr:hypothetical protein [Clostridia bacterium]